MEILRQSTSVASLIGPFVTTSGTALTAVSVTQATVRLSKNGGNMAAKSHAGTSAHDELGFYTCLFDATDTNTLGTLKLMCYVSPALTIWQDYAVVTANVYDTLHSTDQLDVNTTNINGTTATTALVTRTTSALATYDSPTKAEMDTGHGLLATTSTISALNNISQAQVLAQATSALTTYGVITAGTTLTQVSALNNVSTADIVTHATSALATYGAITAGTTLTQVSALNNVSQAQVLAQATSALATYDAPTKAEMDNAHALLATPAQVVTQTTSALTVYTAVQTSTISALNNISTANIVTYTTSALATYDGPTKAEMDTAHGLLATPAQVNAQVLDVLNVDTFTEPAQGAPSATPTMRQMLHYPYKAWRNKKTQTTSAHNIYNDAGAVIDHKATVSGTTALATFGEIGTGA